MAWKQSQVTNLGAKLLSRSIDGGQVIIESAFGGSQLYQASQLPFATEVIGESHSLSITNIEDIDNGKLITLQISSRNLDSGYWLRQIGVFAKASDETEQTLLFIMQDDDGIYIPSKEESLDFTIEIFAALAISNDANIVVNIDSNCLVSIKQLNEAIKQHNDEDNSHNALIERIVNLENSLKSIGNSCIIETTILVSSWIEDETAGDSFKYYADVSVESSKETSFPIATVHMGSWEAAAKANMNSCAQTLAGVVRFFAKNIPESDIGVTIALLTNGGNTTSQGSPSEYTLLPATSTRLGGVKLGTGISSLPDGTISVKTGIPEEDLTTDTETNEMLNDVFNG